MTERQTAIEPLVRAVYGLTALKRDLPRIAHFEQPVSLMPLAVVHRLAPARVKDVACELHVDMSVASRQLAALASAGYIRRDPDPDDRRAQLVSPTEEGERALERAHDRIVAVFASALTDWSAEEITTLTAALDRLRTDYERAVNLPIELSNQKEAA